jgi:hypothetical protein
MEITEGETTKDNVSLKNDPRKYAYKFHNLSEFVLPAIKSLF